MGGEKEQHQYQPSVELGSPPRGRGKARTSRVSSSSRGITPAWAGKRTPHRMTRPVRGDHPRVGGEKPLCKAGCGPQKGSPPRGRGKAQRLLSHSDPLGITPAWAGKRASWSLMPSSERDHPRVGGEKSSGSSDTISVEGSPPRGRGKDRVVQKRLRAVGITPAWAGKSPDRLPPFEFTGDHPRVGGEKTKKIP